MLQVTLNTSLQLGGRTTEFPRSDFNRQVTRFTRHTLLLLSDGQFSELRVTDRNIVKRKIMSVTLTKLPSSGTRSLVELRNKKPLNPNWTAFSGHFSYKLHDLRKNRNYNFPLG